MMYNIVCQVPCSIFSQKKYRSVLPKKTDLLTVLSSQKQTAFCAAVRFTLFCFGCMLFHA